MDLSIAHERAWPEGKVGKDAKILRVSSIHSSRGRLSKRLGYPRWATVWVGVESPGHWVSVFFDLVTGACLRASVTLGADLVILPVFLVLFS